MDHEIAQEYVNYRIGKGWRLREIAQEHNIPTEVWHVLQGFYGILYMEQYVVDHLARQHAQLNR
jgi:hypothetical protein